MLFIELVDLCIQLEQNKKIISKIKLLTQFLKRLEINELKIAVLLIVGRIFPQADSKVLDISGKTVEKIKSRAPSSSEASSLTILDVYNYFEKIGEVSGLGSRRQREQLLEELFSQANEREQRYLIKCIFGEMRHGVAEGVMLKAISEIAGVDLELVRKACMFTGDLGEVAVIGITQGREGLKRIGITLFQPIEPMLAEVGDEIQDILSEHGGKSAFEYKFDGARVQIHKGTDKIKIFSRRLSEVTQSIPEVVELIEAKILANEAILEGEVIAVGREGRPLPFQELMRRFKRIHQIEEMREEIPIKLYLFDLLYLEGKSLIDTPYEQRWQLLSNICPNDLLAERIITSDLKKINEFLSSAIRLGYEGLMAKDLKSFYTPGARGKRWFKIKPAESIDCVIIAAEWGHGRRQGWLSNYHLAVKGKEQFFMVGKTFKGLTDKEFVEMTARLLKLKTGEEDYVVYVKPEVVVEVAYNEIQRSPHYKSGFALRFARITKIRDDKSPEQADTIDKLRDLYERQFKHKAKYLQKSTYYSLWCLFISFLLII